MYVDSFTFLVPMTNFCAFDWLVVLVAVLGVAIGGELLYFKHRGWGYTQIFLSLALPIFLYLSVYSRHILENISTFARIGRYWRLLFPHDMSYAANFPWWLFFLCIGYLIYIIFAGASIYLLIKHYKHPEIKVKTVKK